MAASSQVLKINYPIFINYTPEELERNGYKLTGMPVLLTKDPKAVEIEKVELALKRNNGGLEYDAIASYFVSAFDGEGKEVEDVNVFVIQPLRRYFGKESLGGKILSE
jgi:hypothetical protein